MVDNLAADLLASHRGLVQVQGVAEELMWMYFAPFAFLGVGAVVCGIALWLADE